MTEPTTLSPELLLAIEDFTKALDERMKALISETLAAVAKRRAYNS